jgi:hypothetical protein
MMFFFGAVLATRVSSSLFNPNLFPWCAAGAGLFLFHNLSGLNIVYKSEEQFLRHCGEGQLEEAPQGPPLPLWKQVLITGFCAYFLLVWIIMIGFLWKSGAAYNDGSPVPTATQTEALTSHGHTVYITPGEKRVLSRLEHAAPIGIVSVFVIGVPLLFVLDLKVSSRKPRDR